MRNIALIGFMGTGKSTVAALLAEKLDATLIETDTEVLRSSGFLSINDVFDTKGEEYFRKLEQEVVLESVKKNNCIISCGGGVITSAENIKKLKENAFVVFLHTDFETIKQRLKNTNTRPLFSQEEKAILLYAQRLPIYRQCADIIVETDDKKPEDVVNKILENYKRTANS